MANQLVECLQYCQISLSAAYDLAKGREDLYMRRKSNTNLKWYNRLEKFIYECLGIKLFRKLVFMLERFIHRKDNGWNLNYHIAKVGFSDVEYFTRYLFYNGAIHVRNIGYAITYVLIRLMLSASFGIVDIVVIVMTIKDIYCIILQRYNYLRINERVAVLREKRSSNIKQRAQKVRTSSSCVNLCEEDIQWIRSLRSQLQNKKEYIYISDDDADRLKRLSLILKGEKKEMRNNG